MMSLQGQDQLEQDNQKRTLSSSPSSPTFSFGGSVDRQAAVTTARNCGGIGLGLTEEDIIDIVESGQEVGQGAGKKN